ncbi:hypothetical protein [Sphingomonas qomolangmaensis]|uniref:DUF4350 domain-containing protein n=1 Tax=Sphingomonas qomolangmaensis TaxID=2918765 RepID=A0ABY5LDI3_9SPHN|nr:hypothetical protein [Sphingomonas qomolangmaensis]UUL83951.1 hypothetical protein NMP03_07095 [Sphingomonas qomolangmaensis]
MTGANPTPFGSRAGIVLTVLGALLLLGFLLLSGFGEDINRQVGRVPGPAAKGATGFQALHDILARTPGIEVRMLRERREYATDDLLILTPDRSVTAADLGEIIRQRIEHPTLIILPKWQTERDGLTGTRERRTDAIDFGAGRIGAMLSNVAETSYDRMPGVRRPQNQNDLPSFGPVERPATISGRAITPLVSINRGGALLARVAGSDTYILADPDLANNYGMRDPRNAVAMVAALESMGIAAPGRIAFDLTLHYRPGDRNLVKLMFTPPFIAVTIALLAAAALAGWASIARFGPPLRDARALAFGKAALLDTVAALTRAAGKAGAGGGAYADTMRDWLGQRMRAPGHLHGESLAAWIEAQRPGYAARDQRLRRAGHESELVSAAQGLHDWRQETA